MHLFRKKRIFLDAAGGKRNPSGIHAEGREARKSLAEDRERVARALRCQARDIVFTSGATESDNLALLGVLRASKVEKPHIIISNLEHPAVLEAAREAEREGAELSIVSKDKVLETIRENTILVSLSYASSETGEFNNVPKLARAIRDLRQKSGLKTPFIHCDASQAYSFFPTDIERVGADLLTLDSVLVAKANVELKPIIFGGGQERGLRSGTEDLEKISSLATELERLEKVREGHKKNVESLKQVFLEEIERELPQAVINTPKESLPNIVSLSFPDTLHEFLAIQLDERGVAVSTGSSCDANKNEPDKEALRFSFDENNSAKEMRETVRILKEVMLS